MKYTLVSDGSSERALMPILDWSLRRNGVTSAISSEWADLRRVPNPPRQLGPKVSLAMTLYPCDLLFVHRDAETLSLDARSAEITEALNLLEGLPPFVRVVPVRMMEAWLLQSEPAIRAAANNPRGKEPLNLPMPKFIEDLTDPKTTLHQILESASGLNVRRRRSVNTAKMVHRISELETEFSKLDQLSAFSQFNAELSEVIQRHAEAMA